MSMSQHQQHPHPHQHQHPQHPHPHPHAQYFYAEDINDGYVSSIVYHEPQPAQGAGQDILDPNQGSPIPTYVALQNVAEPRSLANPDLTDMHPIQMAQHPLPHPHHPHLSQQQQQQQQQQQHPLLVDTSYQTPHLHHQPIYSHTHTPIHTHNPHPQQHELLHHSAYQQHPPPSTTSSSSIPSTPPPPSPSDSLSLGHQQLVHTPYSEPALQSPLHSAASSVSDHSFPQSHHHSFFQAAGNSSGSTGSIIGAPNSIGPGSGTPNTTPSSGAPSPSPGGIAHGGHGHGHIHSPSSSTTSSRSSSLVHRTENIASGRYHPHGGTTGRRKVEYPPHPSVTPAPTTPSALVNPSPYATVSPAQVQQQQTNLGSGYVSDGDDDMGILSPTTTHAHPHSHGHSGHHTYPPTVPSQHSPTLSSGHMNHSGPDNAVHARREATRRQRIEAEQRRRDELREGYARLKDVLPITNQKSSKVSLLERAIQYIVQLTKMNEALQARVAVQDDEIHQLRALTDRMNGFGSVGSGGTGPGSASGSLVEGEDGTGDVSVSAPGSTAGYPPLPGSSSEQDESGLDGDPDGSMGVLVASRRMPVTPKLEDEI